MFVKRVSAGGSSASAPAPISATLKRKFDSLTSRAQTQRSSAADDDEEDDDPFGPPTAAASSAAVAPLSSPPPARASRPSVLSALSSTANSSSASAATKAKGSSIGSTLSRQGPAGASHRAKTRHAVPAGNAATPSIAAMFAAVRPAASSSPAAATDSAVDRDSDTSADHSAALGSASASASSASTAASATSSTASSAGVSTASPGASASSASWASVFQPCIDDVLNVDYERKISSWSAHALRRQRAAVLRGTDQQCPRCSALLISTTREDHARLCRPVPPPLRMAIPPERRATLRQTQCLSTWRAEWSGSDLLRLTHAALASASPGERRRYHRALRWLHSVLHAREGADLEEDGPSAAAAASDEGEDDDDAEWALAPGQELWLLIRDGGLACAVVAQTDVRRCATLRLNTEQTRVSVGPRQTSLAAFLSPKSCAASAADAPAAQVSSPSPSRAASGVAASSTASAASSSAGAPPESSGVIVPPLFGVDKIAVHAHYRHGQQGQGAGSGQGSSGGGGAGGGQASLAAHVLHSLLEYYSAQHTLCICANAAASALASATSGPDAPALAGGAPQCRTACARQVAFSDPTQAGRKLAVRFVGRQAFTTYHLQLPSAPADRE